MKTRRRTYRRYCKAQDLTVTEEGYTLWLVKVIDIEEQAQSLVKSKRINLRRYPSASTTLHGIKQISRFFGSILPVMARDKLSPEAKRFIRRDLLNLVKLILKYTNLLNHKRNTPSP